MGTLINLTSQNEDALAVLTVLCDGARQVQHIQALCGMELFMALQSSGVRLNRLFATEILCHLCAHSRRSIILEGCFGLLARQFRRATRKADKRHCNLVGRACGHSWKKLLQVHSSDHMDQLPLQSHDSASRSASPHVCGARSLIHEEF